MPPASFLPISEPAADTSAGRPLLIDFMTSREYGSTEMILLSSTSWTSPMSIPMSSSTLLSTTPIVSLLILSFSRVVRNTRMLRMLGRSSVTMHSTWVEWSKAARTISESCAGVSTTM